MGVTAVILLAGGLSLIALGVLRAPYVTSAGKYGQRVPLQGGGDALFNDDYIRDSILIPNDKLAVGYKPVMPGYKDRITEDEIKQIIVYIRSLK